ncbi:MAG: hypothetical protein BWX70_01913 [Verrucomicrobia bacterium ADurb.Bin070]|nr:MAG: hypothetical protein BWX70_01913 [Verrucomicrobia bacterium ADurb.Bin070]
MEGARDIQRDSLDAQFGGDRGGRGDAGLEAGEHDLRVRVDVGHGEASLVANRLELFGRGAHDADHAAGLLVTRLLHEAPARLKDRERGLEVEHPRDMQRGPLAEAEACGHRELRLRAALAECLKGGYADGENRRLADVGFRQLFGRPLEADLGEVKPQHRVGAGEEDGDLGVRRKVAAHTGDLRPLACKYTRFHTHLAVPLDAGNAPSPPPASFEVAQFDTFR